MKTQQRTRRQTKTTSADGRQLLGALSQMPFIDSAELAGVLGEPRTTVYRALTRLMTHGIAGRISHGTAYLPSSQRYYLTPSCLHHKLFCGIVIASKRGQSQVRGFHTDAHAPTYATTRRCAMDISDGETGAGTPEESWRDIHETMDRARSSMYVAGTATIMLLWAAIASLGVGSQYAILTLASEFAERNPWIYTVLWGILMVPGMVGSGFIGRRAGRKISPGDAARKAGIRVFLYWLAVVVAVFLIPAAAGMWNAEDGDNIPGVAIGIVSLAYILFGIMHRPVLAAVGVGFAAAFYIPNYLMEGNEVMLVSAALMVVVVVLGAWWIRKSGVH